MYPHIQAQGIYISNVIFLDEKYLRTSVFKHQSTFQNTIHKAQKR